MAWQGLWCHLLSATANCRECSAERVWASESLVRVKSKTGSAAGGAQNVFLHPASQLRQTAKESRSNVSVQGEVKWSEHQS